MASGCNQNSSATPRHLQIFNPPLEPCGDFHLFARLPDDIRWLVWQHSLGHERRIDISLNRLDYTNPTHRMRELANSEDRYPVYQMNHVVPIRSAVQSFDRLPYDPRLLGEDLKQVFLGDIDPQAPFNRWLKLLSTSGVQHKHKVIYQFGICRGYKTGYSHKEPIISNRQSAVEWVQHDTDEFRRWFEIFHRSPELRGQIDHEITRVFEESPQPVVGFWSFPMESVFVPEDPKIHGTDTSRAGLTTVGMSQHMPELCLANIY
ncbi:uncharacterized protein Y057_1553 [Fusarium fujikuroi]|nr:uncharacterized protein Y057_1553 [Fusarium fujikuroi]SCO19407.1 uncharacterized protein FFC1_13549 [Fusarium fujikuroi]